MAQEYTVSCMGYEVFSSPLTALPVANKLLINTINQYSYCIAEKDDAFKEALLASDVLLPDGIGIVWASKFLNGIGIKKIAGADLHDFLLHKMNAEHGSCFYMGSSETTLQKIEQRLAKDFPNIRVGTHSPPFKQVFGENENSVILEKVNSFAPDVLFVGMTAPKQEKWSAANKASLNAGMICSIGAVFDFYAGTVQRPGKLWIKLGLEWMGRLFKEPKRMWKRYVYYGIVFARYLFVMKLKGK